MPVATFGCRWCWRTPRSRWRRCWAGCVRYSALWPVRDVEAAAGEVGHHQVAQADVVGAGEGSVELGLAGGGVVGDVEIDAADVGVARRGAGAEAERAEYERGNHDLHRRASAVAWRGSERCVAVIVTPPCWSGQALPYRAACRRKGPFLVAEGLGPRELASYPPSLAATGRARTLVTVRSASPRPAHRRTWSAPRCCGNHRWRGGGRTGPDHRVRYPIDKTSGQPGSISSSSVRIESRASPRCRSTTGIRQSPTSAVRIVRRAFSSVITRKARARPPSVSSIRLIKTVKSTPLCVTLIGLSFGSGLRNRPRRYPADLHPMQGLVVSHGLVRQ